MRVLKFHSSIQTKRRVAASGRAFPGRTGSAGNADARACGRVISLVRQYEPLRHGRCVQCRSRACGTSESKASIRLFMNFTSRAGAPHWPGRGLLHAVSHPIRYLNTDREPRRAREHRVSETRRQLRRAPRKLFHAPGDEQPYFIERAFEIVAFPLRRFAVAAAKRHRAPCGRACRIPVYVASRLSYPFRTPKTPLL